MAEETRYERTLVSIKQLQAGMVILSYIGFSDRYQSMNTETCAFVKHNFKNARARIIRAGKELDVSVEQAAEGDTLKRIYKIPPELRKLTLVNEKLVQALMKRGFVKFEVKKPLETARPAAPKPKVTEKQVRYEKSKAQASKFVQEVKENVETRAQASSAVENIMDDARKGKVGHEGVKQYVDNITENASAESMSAIISLKESDQTYDHCVDVGVIFQSAYTKIVATKGRKSIFDNEAQALLGSFMHDFGKSKVPKDILDSTVRFERDSKEMQMMQSHPVYAVELLAGMGMSEDIINMAHYHHVKQDTTINSCYPKNVSYDQVIYETRLISIIDVYQALVGKRKYKKSWNPPAAMRYLDALAGVEFDMEVWDDFLEVMGLYPKGSLVEFNDGSAAFVMNISAEDPERPQVVIVRNSAGETLTHHTLIDLVEEKEIEIVKDLDAMETFGKDSMEVFSGINIT